MPKDYKTPKYLREFVLSRCLGCTVKVEAIAREFTKEKRGNIPAFGTKALQEYATGAANDYKQIRKAVIDLVGSGEAMRPHEGHVTAVLNVKEG